MKNSIDSLETFAIIKDRATNIWNIRNIKGIYIDFYRRTNLYSP